MKKIFALAVVAIFTLQANVFAQETPTGTFSTTKQSSQSSKKDKGLAIGVEGGYMWELYNDDVRSNPVNPASKETAPDNWKVGLTLAKGKKEADGGLAKSNSVTSIGYNGISDGWGMYFNSDYNKNFRLGKKGNNYFYVGAGSGVNFYIYDDNRYDVIWQAVRIPLGFKFLIKERTEIFLEGTYYLGMIVTDNMGDDPWHDDSGTAQWDSSIKFDHGFEAKAGIRFWF